MAKKKPKLMVKATKFNFVKYEPNKRGRGGDQRRKGAEMVMEYKTAEGVVYRRGEWADPYTPIDRMVAMFPDTILVDKNL